MSFSLADSGHTENLELNIKGLVDSTGGCPVGSDPKFLLYFPSHARLMSKIRERLEFTFK